MADQVTGEGTGDDPTIEAVAPLEGVATKGEAGSFVPTTSAALDGVAANAAVGSFATTETAALEARTTLAVRGTAEVTLQTVKVPGETQREEIASPDRGAPLPFIPQQFDNPPPRPQLPPSVEGGIVISPPPAALTISSEAGSAESSSAVESVGATREAEILARLEALEARFRDAEPLARYLDGERAKIGGNNPPEPIDIEPDDHALPALSEEALRDGFHALNIIRNQYAADRPFDPDADALATSTLNRVAELVARAWEWVTRLPARIVEHVIAYMLADTITRDWAQIANQVREITHSLMSLLGP